MTVMPKMLAQSTIPLGKNVFSPASSNYNVVVPLTSTTSLILWSSGVSGLCRVMTVNADGSVTYGSVYTFNGANASYISAVALNPTTVFIAFRDEGNSYYGTAIIAQISGTTVTFGSKYVFSSYNPTNYTSCTVIDSTRVFIAYQGGSGYGYGIIASISGTVISFGSQSSFNTGTVTYTSCKTLDSSRVLIAFYNNTYGYAVVANIGSGTTISGYGSIYSFNNGSTAYINCVLLSSTSALIAYRDTNGYGSAIIANISGTTITYGTPFQFNLNTNTTNITASLLSGSNVLIGYYDPTNYTQVVVASVNGNNITYGTPLKISGNASSHFVAALNSTTAIMNYYNSANLYSSSLIFTVSGMNVSVGSIPLTLVTGNTDHTEITSIYVVNTGTSAATVTLLTGGTGGLDANVIRRFTVNANSDYVITLPNCPIILSPGDTLRAYQDSTNNLTITVYGLDFS
jgi:hypothetical protein